MKTLEEMIVSPCIGECKLDESKSCCCGCGRTTEQIFNWSMFNKEKRKEISEQLLKKDTLSAISE